MCAPCSILLSFVFFPYCLPYCSSSFSPLPLMLLCYPHAFRTIAYPPFKDANISKTTSDISSSSGLFSPLLILSLIATPSSSQHTLHHPHISNPIMLSYGSIAVARVQHRVMVVQGTYTNLPLMSILETDSSSFVINSVATTRQV